jgi:hypothetical protein
VVAPAARLRLRFKVEIRGAGVTAILLLALMEENLKQAFHGSELAIGSKIYDCRVVLSVPL